MNWSALKRNKCPKCGKRLDFKSDKEMMLCTIECGFMIGVQKMKEIINKKQIAVFSKEPDFRSLIALNSLKSYNDLDEMESGYLGQLDDEDENGLI